MKNGEICIATIYGGTKCDTGKPFTKVKFRLSNNPPSSKLLSNGKVKTKLILAIEISAGGMARAAF
jgi:hypothetical protein